ncbi:GNAT family N-acetyltransferase [Streptomyces winkii]|uniref:GNAT family N-acetyltransferase n=1 Tax=Streptomyces winkii TaxID=3051178 RepID=UPI0028D8F408|nr:GNAT family N-acetyltransferase [Streptomyces sp. DSM 40971]
MIARRDDGYEIATDPDRLDTNQIHQWLSTDAYWALGRSRESVEQSIRASVNYGLYHPDGHQVAYARIITDHATFAWLCDVYVSPAHRGSGLGTWLVTTIRDHLAPHHLPRILLATLDAHHIYATAGFTPLPHPQQFMILNTPPHQPPT